MWQSNNNVATASVQTFAQTQSHNIEDTASAQTQLPTNEAV